MENNKYETDTPCECGEFDLIITSGFVGFMGDAPASEDYGECPKCGKQFTHNQINKRFQGQQGAGD